MRAGAAHGHCRLLIHGGSHEISPRPAVASFTTQYSPGRTFATTADKQPAQVRRIMLFSPGRSI
jgi:hypothetical protein